MKKRTKENLKFLGMVFLGVVLVWGPIGYLCTRCTCQRSEMRAEQTAALGRLNLRYKVTIGAEREGGLILGGAGVNFISSDNPSKVYYCSEYRDVNGAVEFDAYDENGKALGWKRVSGNYTIDSI